MSIVMTKTEVKRCWSDTRFNTIVSLKPDGYNLNLKSYSGLQLYIKHAHVKNLHEL